ncbi:hypothetical protein HMPREF3156_01939 [Neisseria sp. HMSC06F02]|nr:hypothetical protein HMPREF3156_01939 [Neisseria sp. HMSC06F02]
MKTYHPHKKSTNTQRLLNPAKAEIMTAKLIPSFPSSVDLIVD